MATAVKLNPLTGLPVTRVISSAVQAATTPSLSTGFGSSLRPQLPYDEFGDNSSAPKFVGYPGPVPANTGSSGGGGGGGGGGGAPPDYAALVAADPGLQALRAELAAGNISAAQFRKAAIQRAVIAYGQAPDEAALDPTTRGYYTEDVDQLTKDLATKNTSEGLSTRAQLDRSHQVALQGLKNILAARGMLQSGALGVGLGLEGQRDKGENAKATGALLDYLSGQAQAYAEHLHQSKLTEAQAIMDTTQAYMQNYAGGLGSGGGGGGGGGGGPSADFIYDARPQGGFSAQDYWNSAVAGAPAGAKPLHIMNQGGISGGKISIKYLMPNGQTNTIWVPIAGPQQQAPPPPAAAPPVAPTAPAPAPVPVTTTPVGAGTIRPGGGY